jgi:LysR family glycine cleavage system transcriptional activator
MVHRVPMPSIDDLRCFLAAAKHLNFRRAAKEVFLTPTAFGQRIKGLEELLGRELFKRTTRSVSLTQEGLSLVPVAREALASVRRCSEVVLSGEEPPVRLMVGTRFELGLSWVLPSFLALEKERPSWHLDTYFGSGDDILARLRSGEMDCVVTSASISSAEWNVHVLHPEEYVLVGAPALIETHPFNAPEDALNHTVLDVNSAMPLSRYLAAENNPTLMFGDVRFCGAGSPIVQLVRLGVGVAVVPLYMVEKDLRDGTLTRLLPEMPLLTDTFRLLYRREHPLTMQLEFLADYLRSCPLT